MKSTPRPPLQFSALDFERNPPSIANLPAALTINGITVLPTFRYKGGDAGAALWKPWGYGEILTLQAGTAPTLNNGSPLLGTLDDSVKFNAGGYYQASNGAFADVTTEDFVVEAVLSPLAVASTFAGKYVAASAAKGIRFYRSTTTLAGFGYGASAGGYAFEITCPAGWVHVIWFYDKSGSSCGYLNGQRSNSNVVSTFGSLTSSDPFFIGQSTTEMNIAYLAMWKKENWLDQHVQEFLAKTRLTQLTSVYPQSARGTYLPSTFARLSDGYLDKIEANGTRKLYYMANYWPRVCSRPDANGIVRKGYLSETSAQNICLQSHTFATTWTPTYVTVPTTAVLCPDGVTRTTCTIHEDATATNAHCLKSGAAGPTAGTTNVFSCFVKAVNRSWVRFSYGTFVSNFNVSTGVLGTQTNATGIIQNYGNGWYRCSAVFTGAGAGYFYIEICESDNDASFSGLDQDSLYIFGAQAELGNYPSSYIPTTTTAVTRSADNLRYNMAYKNICLQSQTFATTWSAARASVPTTAVVCPDGVTRTTCTIHEDATAANSHTIYQSLTTTAVLWIASVYAKAVNRNWLQVAFGAAASSYFNLATGALGTLGGAATNRTAKCESVGNGWYRCSVSWIGTAVSDNFYLTVGEADNDNSFDGLNQDSLYVYGAQMEMLYPEMNGSPSAYKPTTTTAVSMSNGNMSSSRGALECNVLLPSVDMTSSPYYWQISDGTATYRLYLNAAATGDDFATFLVANSGLQAQVIGTTDIWNNAWNKLRGVWGPNDARMLVNSVSEGTPDTTVTVPQNLTQLDVGAYLSAGYEINGLIANLRLLGKGATRG